MGERIVDFKNVNFSFGSGLAVENVSFSISKGEFVGMIGPNGSGKSTIVKLMLHLLNPDSGKIMLFGTDIQQFADWKKIGYVPQKATFFDQNFPATVFEVVSMGRFANAGLGKPLSQNDKEHVIDALRQVGMLEYAKRRIGDLSGGQQQRVFIARALATKPELLILDEPTVGVDSRIQHSFYQLLKKLNKAGITLILVSHDVGVVSRNVSKLLCVNRKVNVHDISNGISKADLTCAYYPEFEMVPHHH
ncbi:metal ABC transporter ATP-binding protein [Candidatus Micrarchaeota archaeon]|nr:metal ABC transporter ATP-binding protein [Candidatus Micrarchaeota archaeon]